MKRSLISTHNIKYFLTWEISESEGMLEKTIVEEFFFTKLEEYKETMKSVGDSQAQEILECVVDCLVSKICVTFQYCLSWVRGI